MRTDDVHQRGMSSYVTDEERIPQDHPLRSISKNVDTVLKIAREHDLLSDEHFTIDGTLIEAWASHKSFRPKGEEPPTGGGSDPDFDRAFRRW